ncbi:hypothetical protein [Alkalilimnicola ehrlichii]|nr:hypothetical protein [Alkalilimnicola ehrlichii]
MVTHIKLALFARGTNIHADDITAANLLEASTRHREPAGGAGSRF